jgi:hypothetical protein
MFQKSAPTSAADNYVFTQLFVCYFSAFGSGRARLRTLTGKGKKIKRQRKSPFDVTIVL